MRAFLITFSIKYAAQMNIRWRNPDHHIDLFASAKSRIFVRTKSLWLNRCHVMYIFL